MTPPPRFNPARHHLLFPIVSVVYDRSLREREEKSLSRSDPFTGHQSVWLEEFGMHLAMTSEQIVFTEQSFYQIFSGYVVFCAMLRHQTNGDRPGRS